MPDYEVTDAKTGKTLILTGDSPPTEAELAEIFGQYETEPAKAEAPTPEPSTWDRVKDAAYQSSPLPLFERKNLPITGAALAAAGSGGALIPAIALAGMGGASGETIGQILETIQGKRTTPDARAVLTEGGKQAALQATGGVIGKGLAAGGRGLYRYALKPSKAIQSDVPNVVSVGLRESKPVTIGGLKRAEAATTVSRDAADRMIAEAEQSGAGDASLRTVVRALRPVRDEARKQTKIGLKDRTPEIGARARALRDQFRSGKVPLTEAQTLKRTAQGKATAAYAARDKGAVIDDIGTMTDEAVAKGLRESIEARVPNVRPVNQRTAELGGLTHALEDASTRNPGYLPTLMSSLIGGGGALASGDIAPLLGAYGFQAMLSPRVASSAGIAASKAPPFLPDAIRAALLEYLDSQE